MACDDCLGFLLIGAVSLLISISLMKKYFDSKNKFTLYMTYFFLLNASGYLFWFICSEWILNIEDSVMMFLRIYAILPQLALLIFTLTFYEVSKQIRLTITIAAITVTLVWAFFPDHIILFIIATMAIIFSNIVLFLRNWRKNNDIKSLGFSIGLVFLFLAGSASNFNTFFGGICYILTAITWAITYSGLIDKKE
jgi:hypothetical protein